MAGKENGLLLLFSRDDRKIRFEVGYGMEGVITDSISGRLLDEQALPFFREGQYGRGLYAVAKAAAEAIGKANSTPLDLTDPAAWPAQVTPAPTPRPEEAATPEKKRRRPTRFPRPSFPAGLSSSSLFWDFYSSIEKSPKSEAGRPS